MDALIKTKLESIFGPLAVDTASQLEAAYGEAIKRMLVKEALALSELINGKRFEEARELIRSKMTAQELADEKSHLGELTFDSAAEGAGQWNIFGAMLSTGLRILLVIALGAAGF